MSSELSPTDARVINYLRGARRSASAISKACFPGGNVRPAAAHLARMQERQLVQKAGPYWELTPAAAEPSPELPL